MTRWWFTDITSAQDLELKPSQWVKGLISMEQNAEIVYRSLQKQRLNVRLAHCSVVLKESHLYKVNLGSFGLSSGARTVAPTATLANLWPQSHGGEGLGHFGGHLLRAGLHPGLWLVSRVADAHVGQSIVEGLQEDTGLAELLTRDVAARHAVA